MNAQTHCFSQRYHLHRRPVVVLGVFPVDFSITVRELQFFVTENTGIHHFYDWFGLDVCWDIIQLYTQKREN
jgi:hypothetical protein